MGVKPAQVADLLALKGDSMDNIPGAPGHRRKRRAKHLITRFGSVEGALEHAAEVEQKTYRESLQNNREQILLSKRLATIDTTVPVEFEMANLAAQEPDIAELKKVYKELEFYSLLKEVGPTEDAHTRDYASIFSREEAAEFGASLAKLDAREADCICDRIHDGWRSAADDDRGVVSAGSGARAVDRFY